MNFAEFLGTPFLQNTSGRLLTAECFYLMYVFTEDTISIHYDEYYYGDTFPENILNSFFRCDNSQ